MNRRAATFSTNTKEVISLSLSEVLCGFGPIAWFFFFFFLNVKCWDEEPGSMGCCCTK